MAEEKRADDTPAQAQPVVVDSSDEPPKTMAEALRKLWTPKKLVVAISR